MTFGVSVCDQVACVLIVQIEISVNPFCETLQRF